MDLSLVICAAVISFSWTYILDALKRTKTSAESWAYKRNENGNEFFPASFIMLRVEKYIYIGREKDRLSGISARLR